MMTTDLRSMLIGQLLAGEGIFHHLDYWDIFQLHSPATEEEERIVERQFNDFEFTADGIYELQLSASQEHIRAFLINCHRLLSPGIPTEQYFEKKH